MSSHALIIGCGYLGKVLARQLRDAGARVIGTVRSESGAAALRDLAVEPAILDITAADAGAVLARLLQVEAITHVYCCVPPSVEGDPIAAFSVLAAALRTQPLQRAVLTSSTAVYGDHDGGRVDADSPVAPADVRGQRLLAIEQAWMQIGDTARVVRMAGLYGPGRVIGAAALLAGKAVGGNPDDQLNLIHIEDAAALLRAVAHSDTAGRIELGADGVTMPRREYYTALAATLGKTVRFEAENAQGFGGARRAGSRQCDITLTCGRTGWQPRHVDARQQLAQLLNRSPL